MLRAKANVEQNFAEQLAKKYSEFEKYDGTDAVVSLQELAEILKTQDWPKTIKSGLPTFDRELYGFAPGELVVISGSRKSGKTLFGQSLTRTFSKNGVKCLWFSFELSPGQFVERFPEIPQKAYTPKTLQAYSLEWLRNRIMEGLAKNGINVIFLDHLHFLLDLARVGNLSIELGYVIRYIKRLAVELNLVIFVMCHLTKTDPHKEPCDSDIRDSSFICQESDMGILVWREREKDINGDIVGLDTAWLKICYDRRNGVIDRKIKLIKRNGLLEECATNVVEHTESKNKSYDNKRYPT